MNWKWVILTFSDEFEIISIVDHSDAVLSHILHINWLVILKTANMQMTR
jgi:hypothetical protein